MSEPARAGACGWVTPTKGRFLGAVKEHRVRVVELMIECVKDVRR